MTQLTYIKSNKPSNDLKEFTNKLIYQQIDDNNNLCHEYGIINNYPFYFKMDPNHEKNKLDTFKNYINKCFFHKDSKLDKFDFSGTEIQNKKSQYSNYWRDRNENLNLFNVYELSYNQTICNVNYKPISSNDYINLNRIIYNDLDSLIDKYKDLSNNPDSDESAKNFETAITTIIDNNKTYHIIYKLSELIECRKNFANIIKLMDSNIYDRQKILDKILQSDSANNGKLNDIEFMNIFVISKSIVLLLFLIISTRFIIKYKK